MGARPIVHIGYHKTATTWFQKSFYPYVADGRYVPRELVRKLFLDPTAFQFDPVATLDRIARERGEKILICEEGLSGYLHNGGLAGHLSKEMVHRLRATLPDAQIVIFVRSQPAMIAAAYQQYVKGGGTYSIGRYLFARNYLAGASSENAKIPRFTFDHFEYDRLIALYRSEFGAENVHVFLFEEFRKDSRAFLERFCATLELDVALDDISAKPAYRSYNLPALYVSRFMGLFTYRTVMDKHWIVHIPYWYLLTRAVAEGLSKLVFFRTPTPRALLGKKLMHWIEQHYAESNRRLAAETGLPLEKFGYPMRATNEAGPAPIRPWLPRWVRI